MRHVITTVATAVALALAVAPARAQHADWEIASTAPGSGQLAIEYDFETVVGLDYDPTLSGLLGASVYTSTDPGFDTIAADEPLESLFRLPAGANVTVEITAIDAGKVAVFFPAPAPTLLDSVGDTYVLGTQDAAPPNDLHHHGDMRLILSLPSTEPGEGSFSFRLTTTTPGFTSSEIYTVKLSNTHLFVDFAGGSPKTNLTCQQAIGKSVAKFMATYAKTLYGCLDAAAAIVANEEQGLDTAAAEAKAAKACGDNGGVTAVKATLLGKLEGAAAKASSGISVKCGAAFDADKIARHLNKAACGVQAMAAQGYIEARGVLSEITQAGTPVADSLPCLTPTQAGEGEAPF